MSIVPNNGVSGITPAPSLGLLKESKGDIVHVDDVKVTTLEDLPKPGDGPALLKSRFDELSAWKTLWVFRTCVWYVFVLTTMNLLDSWQISIAGSIIVNKGFIRQFGDLQPDGTYVLSDTWLSAWGAIINVGQLSALWYCPYIANRYGRKWAYFLCWCNFIACLLCLTFAKTPGVWCLGKWFVGMAAGCVQMTTGPYLVEIAPNRIRGVLSVFPGLWSGACGVANSVMMVVTNDRYPYDYHMPIWVLWGLSLPMLAAIIHIPESPWVHARHGNKKKGLHCLKRLYGNVPGYNYEEEWGIIVGTLEHERVMLAAQNATKWKDLIVGQNLRRTLIIVGSYTAQMWGGLSMIGTYGTYFFSIAGLKDPFLASMILSCIGLGNTVFQSLLIDSVGRRPLACVSYTTTSLMLWLMGGLYYVPGKAAGVVLVALTCIWQCAFGNVGAVYSIQSSEIPSAELRVKTVTTALMVAASWGIITCFCVPVLLTNLQIRGCFVFGATSFPFVIAYWFFCPETKSRSASEIDELFESHIPAWRWRKYKTAIEEHTHEVVTQAAEESA